MSSEHNEHHHEAQAQEAPKVYYCLKCKAKQPIKDATQVTLKSGRAAMRGVCSICNTTMVGIGTGIPGEAAKATKAQA